jgi:hypothetical protein
VSIDERQVALPKLYGAPAYARPPAPIDHTDRPFDPDQLPIQAYQTDEERRIAARMPAHRYGSATQTGEPGGPIGRESGGLRPRQFRLRAIAGRLLGRD